ncbi:MAG: hypothetical protein LLF95_10195 [Bacteroidales bacterium]|nr:hypothetical protein [Bacteroidales bacterium]
MGLALARQTKDLFYNQGNGSTTYKAIFTSYKASATPNEESHFLYPSDHLKRSDGCVHIY